MKASEELLDRAATSGANAPEAFNAKAFRRSLNKTGRYTRQPTNDKESLALMDDHGVGYSLRGLVAQMKENGGVWQQVRSCEWRDASNDAIRSACTSGATVVQGQTVGTRTALHVECAAGGKL